MSLLADQMPDDTRLRLTAAQQRFHDALVDRQSRLGEWYRAAVAVLNDQELPDRLSLAAHALREVMEKLPGDGVALDRGADLPTKVRALQEPWANAQQENLQHGGIWDGAITDLLWEFLTASRTFFDGQAQLVNQRRDYARRFMETLDGTAGLPPDVQEQNAGAWMRFHRYFDSVAHHKTVTEQEFLARMAGFEVFIAARLRPRPTEDFDSIDLLIQEP